MARFTIRESGTITSITNGELGVYRHEHASHPPLEIPDCVYELTEPDAVIEEDPAIAAALDNDLSQRNIKPKRSKKQQ